jgi:ABC-2 type transport system ATP-binding protein
MIALETQGLGRTFGTHTAVEGLDLSIPSGSVFGFLGPNGAGKTTTVRMLCALIAPSSGSAQVAGYRLGADNAVIRRHVGILTETPGLYESLSALQNLVFFARLYDLPVDEAHTRAERYLHMLDLWERRDEAVGGFSKGMRQKLAIARSLLHEPQIVFLDEPTSGLDPAAARTVRDFIRDLRSEGRTIFLTTHNLTEADELCDLIGIFRTHLLRLDTPANLRTDLFGQATLLRFAGDPLPWRALTESLPFVRTAEVQDSALLVRLDDPEAHNPALIRALVQAGAELRFVEPTRYSLEDVYFELIGADR